MKIGARMIFKHKPILHSKETTKENGRAFIIVKPCGFCNERFHCMDVVITSCIHTFHPFFLGSMLKDSNKCYVCNVRFHLKWWASWGFWEVDEELMELAK
jgi:hypothetical protein